MLRPKISIDTRRGPSAPLAQTSSAVKITAATAAPAWNQPRSSGFGAADSDPTVVCICRVMSPPGVPPLRRHHEQPRGPFGVALDLEQQAAAQQAAERPDRQPVEAE